MPINRPSRLRLLANAWKLLLIVLVLALAALYVTNASRPGQRVEGCPVACAITSARRPGPLRVMDLNMLHGFPDFKSLPTRVELIAQEARRLDADVLLLQEVPWTIRTGSVARSLAAGLGYNYLYYRASGNRSLIFFEEGEAILSRFPLQRPASQPSWPRPWTCSSAGWRCPPSLPPPGANGPWW